MEDGKLSTFDDESSMKPSTLVSVIVPLSAPIRLSFSHTLFPRIQAIRSVYYGVCTRPPL